MALSYEYSIGSIRAKEKNLLTKQDIERMSDFTSLSELTAFLHDKNYGSGQTVEEILNDNAIKSWEYIKSIIPDEKLFYCFFYKNDIHNIKSAVKGTLSQVSYEHLFIEPSTISTEDIIEAVNGRKFNGLPEWVSTAAQKAYDITAHTGDARLADAYLDKACMKAMIKTADSSDNEFLKNYTNETVFYCDIKTAIRASRTSSPKEFYEASLCEVDSADIKAIEAKALKGVGELLDYLSLRSEYGCSKAAEAYLVSPSEFEKYTDNRFIAAAKECCKRSSEGADAAIGYYIALQTQNKAIHIIESAIRTQTDKKTLKERLRLVYG
jgi:V/A-type H+-transporting ATPase subunit C